MVRSYFVAEAIPRLFLAVFTTCIGMSLIAPGLGAEDKVAEKEKPMPEGEAFFFIPSGFVQEGEPKTVAGEKTGQLQIVVRDEETGQPVPCRINVIGSDGNFYQPEANSLTPYSLTGQWPDPKYKGNRKDKAPYRYLGRFFYSTGEIQVNVPPGATRIEVYRGFEYRPQSQTVTVQAGSKQEVSVRMARTLKMAELGWYGGDPHLHFTRATEQDDQTILNLLEAEDIWYGTPLGYNEPAGPYAGFMDRMDSPQFRGLGKDSIQGRGFVRMLSGQEYRSGQYGHLNLFMRDRLVFEGQSHNADEWPVYGHVGNETRSQGGISIHAHGGYALEIYADAALGSVDGVELLQFGIYRGIGLEDWYHMLNTGYRFPCVGASDYPACRFLGDCRTYIRDPGKPAEPVTGRPAPAASGGDIKAKSGQPEITDWLTAAAQGRSFVTTGPMVLLEVNGHHPGDIILEKSSESITAKVQIQVSCEVTPVKTVDLIVNGRAIKSFEIPAESQKGSWFSVEHEVTLPESSWIAARAWSVTRGGQPDAESHTNPVYVYLRGRKPYVQSSLDAWVKKIDGQIERHTARTFAKKAQVLDYFQSARDLLLDVRQRQGLTADEDPAALAEQKKNGESGGLMSDLARPDATDEELREFLKPVPAKPPLEAVKTFEGVQGFTMQLVAAEPLVTSPVAAAFDADGNMFVCEMRDYPYKPADGLEPIGRVSFLRDTDGDGDFDESHIFADKLLWAAGVVPWKGGAFVAATPDIWYFKDTDGDFKADIRRKVFTGFGTGNQQAMVNNLQMGLDHWIYGSTAGNGGIIRPGGDPDAKPVSVTGRDFRFDPVTEKFELVTGTIQFGNTFDDWGNRFVCSESQPLLQIVLPDHYLARNPFLPSPYGIQNIAPGPVPIYRISPIERWRQVRSSRRIAKNERAAASAGASHHVVDAAAGAMVYRGGAYPPDFYGQVFVGDGQNNLIHRRRLSENGVTFQSHRVDEQTEVMRSSDIWFRPVNMINAPDGTLYCLDMSREVLESIHIPLDVVKHLDLRSGRDNGRIYRMAPPEFVSPTAPRLSRATGAELVAALESEHGWWRDTANRLLFEKQDQSVVPALQLMARESKSPASRVLALWTLEGLSSLDHATCLAALKDSHPGVVENAIRLAEPRLSGSPELLSAVCQLATSDVARVRFQTAFSLGASDSSEAIAALARLARRDGTDPWIRTAILSSASATAEQLLAELLRPASLNDQNAAAVNSMIAQLVQVVGSRNQPEEVQRTLDAIAESEVVRNSAGVSLLSSLGEGLKRSGGQLRADSGNSAGSVWLREVLTRMENTAADAQASVDARAFAVSMLSCGPSERHREIFVQLLSVDQPEALQLAAVRALADDPDGQIPALLLERWPTFLPEVRKAALNALLSREAGTLALLESAADQTVSVADIEQTRRELLLQDKNPRIRELAGKLFGTSAAGSRQAIVQSYKPSLELKGDLQAGQLLFDKHCSVCHQMAGKGYAIGPNLASSPSKDPSALLTHILDPNQYVLPNYLQYVAVDRNGRSYTGLLAAQTATSISLKKEKGETVTLLRGDVEELVSSNRSLMPEGLEKELSHQAMADLMAWLSHAAAQAPGDPNAERDFGTLPGLIETTRE